jgi:dTMP kinase
VIICIEGIDAAGKATQSKLLAERIEGSVRAFPDYTTPTGLLIGSHLKGDWDARQIWGGVGDMPSPEIDGLVFQALMTVNRLEHAVSISAERERGRHLVLDRYWPSGVVYGQDDGLDRDYLINIHTWLPQADVYLLLDVDPRESVLRRPERRDRYEKRAGLMERAAKRYRELWTHMDALYPRFYGKWCEIDGRGTIEEVHERIYETVSSL